MLTCPQTLEMPVLEVKQGLLIMTLILPVTHVLVCICPAMRRDGVEVFAFRINGTMMGESAGHALDYVLSAKPLNNGDSPSPLFYSSLLRRSDAASHPATQVPP